MAESEPVSSPTPATTSLPFEGKRELLPWLYRVIRISQVQIQVQFRDSQLHLLVAAEKCPDRAIVVRQMVQALRRSRLEQFLPEGQFVGQVLLYGQALAAAQPAWVNVIHLDRIHPGGTFDPTASVTQSETQPDREPRSAQTITISQVTQIPDPIESPQPPFLPDFNSAPSAQLPLPQPSLETLAREGQPTAIANYLQAALSHRGIQVKITAQVRALSPTEALPALTEILALLNQPTAELSRTGWSRRLWLLCDTAVSASVSQQATFIHRTLRSLDLQGFQDALISSRGLGQRDPDWLSQVDLTPAHNCLKQWARWADLEALSRLLNQSLNKEANQVPEAQPIQVMLDLLDGTLHISCRGKATPDQALVMGTIFPLLEMVSPQGIHGATIYGLQDTLDQEQADKELAALLSPLSAASPDAMPCWVQWLELPAAHYPAFADSTEVLAQQGDLDAIGFLLTRRLNPDLDTHLTTGGIRVQVRRKDDLLHVMADAILCPEQSTVESEITPCLQTLDIPKIHGIRVYGRRMGEIPPQWRYGVDFVERSASPADTPPKFELPEPGEVGEWVRQDPEMLIAAPRSKPGSLRIPGLPARSRPQSTWGERLLAVLQRSLLRSQLFRADIPNHPTHPSLTTQPDPRRKLAMVWGSLGVVLLLQSELILGWILHNRIASQSPPAAASTPTQPALPPAAFSASPLRPKAQVGPTQSGSTFNAQQLDEKLALYRQYVTEFGPPDVLVVGSSRAMRGVDPQALEQALADRGFAGLKVFNLGINGATAQVVDLIVRRMLPREHLPKLLLWADGSRAFNSGRSDLTYTTIAVSPGFRKLPTPENGRVIGEDSILETLARPFEKLADGSAGLSHFSETLNIGLTQELAGFSGVYRQREQLQHYFRDQLPFGAVKPDRLMSSQDTDSLPLDGQGWIDNQGFLPLSIQFDPVTYYQKHSRVAGESDGDYDNFTLEGQQSQALRQLMQFSHTYRLPVVFVSLPLTETYLDAFRQQREQEFQQYMLRASRELGFTYRDLVEHSKTRHELFSDPSHLNRYGAHVVSTHLTKDPIIPWRTP